MTAAAPHTSEAPEMPIFPRPFGRLPGRQFQRYNALFYELSGTTPMGKRSQTGGITEHALAHKLEDEAEAAYQCRALLLKRAVVMERGAQLCNQASPKLPDIAKLLDKRTIMC